MNWKNKKTYYLLGGLLLLIIVLFIFWRFISRPLTEEIPEGGGGNILPVESGTGTAAKKTELVRVADRQALDYWIVRATGELFYLTPDGKIYLAVDGIDLEISAQTFQAINRIMVSASGSRILMAFGDPSSPDWGIFDIYDRVWRPLPYKVMGAAWGKSDHSFYAFIEENGIPSLAEIDLSKSQLQKKVLLANFRLNGYEMLYLSGGQLLFVEKPLSARESIVYAYDTMTGKFNSILSSEYGLMLYPANSVVYFYSNNSSFGIRDALLNPVVPSPFDTLPPKCAFVAGTSFCFVPQDLPQSLELPDEYLNRSFFSTDDLFFVDHESGDSERLFASGNSLWPAVDGSRVEWSKGSVYFLNRMDKNIYRLTVPHKIFNDTENRLFAPQSTSTASSTPA